MFDDLPRRHASLIMQMRSGHIGLNKFLHRIGASESPLCNHCDLPETVPHYLLCCRRFDPERHALRRKVKGQLSLRTLLSTRKARSALIEYIEATKRFPLYSRDINS